MIAAALPRETMSSIILILNVVLICTCSACVLACLQVQSKTAYLVAAHLISYADIVLILELAGLLSSIGPMPVLGLQLILTMVVLLVWFLMGRPPLLGPFVGLKLPRLSIQSLIRAFDRSPLSTSLVILLAAGVAYVYLRHAGLIFVVPPNNWDSLTYHLSRIGYWLQYQSLYPWPSSFIAQTTLPINGELGSLWTILWWGTDQLTGFVQWAAVPSIVLGIYGLTRLLGSSPLQAALVALLWPTLTQVVLQSSTTQIDLVSASFCVATFYFLFAGWREKAGPYTYLSGLAFGLAVGTKGVILLTLPGLGCAAMIVLWLRRRERRVWRFVFRWIAVCVLGVLLFGSYTFVQNTLAFGSPLGPLGSRRGPTDLGTVDLSSTDLVPTLLRLLRDNSARHIYELVDFSPLPLGAAEKINPLKAQVFSSIFQVLHISVENKATIFHGASFSLQQISPLTENDSWFGPLGAVLVLVVIYHIIRAVKHTDALRVALALIAIGYFAAQSALQLWYPALGRFYLVPIALSFPLMSDFLDTRTLWRAAVASLLVLLGLLVMFNVTLGESALREVTWESINSGVRADPAWLGEFNYRMVSENVPLNASIGVDKTGNFRDYPFFGEHFTRRVTLAIPDDASILPRGDLGRYVSDFESSDFLFIVGTKSHSIQDLASNAYDLLSAYDGDSIWIRKNLRSSNECDDRKWPFTDFYHSLSSEICPQFPVVRPKVPPRFVHLSFLRTGRYAPVIGVGPSGKFEFSLLVKEPTTARLGMQVEPLGAGSQTLQLVLSAEGSEPMTFSGSFNTQEVLEFVVRLQPALYTVQLGLADGGEASIRRFQVTTP